MNPYCIEGDDVCGNGNSNSSYLFLLAGVLQLQSIYTKLYKSLETYNQVLEGWITKVNVYWYTVTDMR